MEEIQARRARVAARYRAELAGWAQSHGAQMPPLDAERRGNDHLFYLLLADEDARDRCLSGLRARGVRAAFHYVPLHTSPHGRRLGAAADLPVTDRVARTLVRLPLHPRLSDEDVDRVVGALKQAIP
jgi:dTDP-4-amino-4,6-dideoxygalactose transaminase